MSECLEDLKGTPLFAVSCLSCTFTKKELSVGGAQVVSVRPHVLSVCCFWVSLCGRSLWDVSVTSLWGSYYEISVGKQEVSGRCL